MFIVLILLEKIMRIPSLSLMQRLGERIGQSAPVSDTFDDLLEQAKRSDGSGIEQATQMAALANLRMMSATMAAFGEGADREDGSDAGLLNALGDIGHFSIKGSEAPQAEDDNDASVDEIIKRASQIHGVDKDLIGAVIKAESGFDPKATSPKGAMGLMQLMPATARGLGVRNAYDPEENIMAGTRFLKSLLDRYDGDVPKALAAYNWGPGNVDRSPARLPLETRNYISRITADYLNRQS